MTVEEDLQRCVDLLASGGVVAIPTETVYGLAADAGNAAAVARVFSIKQRPARHPLIVHLGERDWVDDWARSIPAAARELARTFWPGPLTLVLERGPRVLPIVTGGQDSVAVRVPDHALALRLIRALERPLVAPSANRFTKVSPTSAEDVRRDLGSAVDFVLEGGRCRLGLESTIVDLRGGGAWLLRPGAIPAERIEAALGQALECGDGSVRVPGQHAVHYAPDARVSLVPAAELRSRAQRLSRTGLRVGVLVPPGLDAAATFNDPGIMPIAVPAAIEDYAACLYRFLRDFDAQGCDLVLASLPEAAGIGAAVRDRLQRAAGP